MSLDQRFAGAMGQLLGPDFPSEIALAVSGGGDSMAMLTLAHNWTRAWGVGMRVVTVDHGLRPEAADEAAMVADLCAELGWPHDVLRWTWDGTGNVMDAARRARLDLIDDWRGPLRHVLMAHTRDDVAETFLMRLERGSGVDGLSAMRARRFVPRGTGGFWLVRPCLGMRREELRHYLRVLRGRWAEDPTNDDRTYGRARMRALLPVLEEAGLGVDRLAGTATRLARAREALARRAQSVWDEIGTEGRTAAGPTGDILFARDGFAAVEDETRLRLVAAALQFVSSNAYRPRAAPLESLVEQVLSGGGGTLHGCEVLAEGDRLRVFREYKAVAGTQAAPGQLWDGRWRAVSHALRPLGDAGWQALADPARALLPYRVARVLPMVAGEDGSPCCPALDPSPASARPDRDMPVIEYRPMGKRDLTFRDFLLSH